jgi:hypothetical protein
LLFVSIHTIDGHKVQQVGRTAVLIQGEGSHTQSFTLLHCNGTPVLSQTGHPATIQMQYSYSPASRAEAADQHHQLLVEDFKKSNTPRSRSKSNSRMPRSASPAKKIASGDGEPQISATLGFFGSASIRSGENSGASSSRDSGGSSNNLIDVEILEEASLPVPGRVLRSPPPAPRGANSDSGADGGIANASVASAGEVMGQLGLSSYEKQAELPMPPPPVRSSSKTDPSRTGPGSNGRQGSGSNGTNSLATSQSSTVSFTLDPAQPDRSSPRITPRKNKKLPSVKTRVEKTEGSENTKEPSRIAATKDVEVVHIVRQSSNENTSNRSRVGIGISFGVTRSGEIFITGLSPKGAAKASGKVKENDQLLAVDGVDIKGWQVADIVQLILGKPGTKVKLDLVPAVVPIPASVGPQSSNPVSSAPDSKQPEPKWHELKAPEPKPKDDEVRFVASKTRDHDKRRRQA